MLFMLGVVLLFMVNTEVLAADKEFAGMTLHVLGHNSKQTEVIFEFIIPEWEKKTGARVVTSSLPAGEVTQKLVAEFVAKSGAYDVVQNSDLPSIYQWLEPLTPYLTDPKKTASDYDFNDFIATHVKLISTYQDTLYMIPWRSDVRWLYYRKDLFAAKGLKPAKTWDKHLENARKLNDPPNMYGIGVHARQYGATLSVFAELLWSHGGDFLSADWKPIFHNEAGVKALEVYVKLLDYMPPDKFSFGAYEVATAFMQERIAMAHNWPLLAGLAVNPEQSKVVGKWDAALMPAAPGHKSATMVGGWGWGIPKDSKKKEAAWSLIQYMTTKEAEKKIILNGGEANPTRASTLQDADVQAKFFHFPIMEQAFANGRATPRIPEWPEIRDAVVLAMTEAGTGKKSPKQALDDAAKKAEAVLKEAGYYKK
jgi:multiple sugar transport system substrate-binding protein